MIRRNDKTNHDENLLSYDGKLKKKKSKENEEKNKIKIYINNNIKIYIIIVLNQLLYKLKFLL